MTTVLSPARTQGRAVTSVIIVDRPVVLTVYAAPAAAALSVVLAAAGVAGESLETTVTGLCLSFLAALVALGVSDREETDDTVTVTITADEVTVTAASDGSSTSRAGEFTLPADGRGLSTTALLAAAARFVRTGDDSELVAALTPVAGDADAYIADFA